VIKHNMFGKAMRKVDPTIILLGTGATPEEMVVNGLSPNINGKYHTEFGSETDFSWALLTNCLDYIDMMSEHFYAYSNQRFDLELGKRVEVQESLVDWVRRPANRVRGKIEAYEEYYRRIPALKSKRVPMVIDEWAYTRTPNNLKQALANAAVLQEMFRRTDVIKMAGHTMATSSIEHNATESALSAARVMFKMYRDHFGTIPVEVGGNSPQPAPKFPVGGDQPRNTSGSPTFPVDVSAALSADGKLLTIAVINPTESAQELELGFRGVTPAAGGRMWRMTGPDVNAQTGLRQKQIQLTGISLSEAPKVLAVAPISISIYEFPKH
jgi:alpha-N-arabinofuranosidase